MSSLFVDYTMYSHGNLLDDNSFPCSIPMQSLSKCAAVPCRDTYRQICARRSWDDLRLHIRNSSGTRRDFRIKCRLPRLVHIENTDRRSTSLTPNFDSTPLQHLRHEAAPVSLHISRGISHCTGQARARSACSPVRYGPRARGADVLLQTHDQNGWHSGHRKDLCNGSCHGRGRHAHES